MENKEFKNLFGLIAEQNGFRFQYGGWFKESDECIVVIDLQKSNYGNYYELNIKTYIQGVFGIHYSKCKDLVKKDTGDLFTRQPKEYNDAFDLENLMDTQTRKNRLEKLFNDFIVPDTNKTLSKAGIIELAKSGEYILPAVKKELGI